jgi:hypothetical protein
VGNINEVQPGPGSQASRRLIQPLSNVATINYFDPSNRSTYNGLHLKLNQRFAHGLQFLVSYTFGKSLDYAGSPASGGGQVGGPQSVTLFDESRGPSGFDVKHRFVTSWVWALPFGEGRRFASAGPLKPILEDWEFSGIVTWSTGRPFTVTLNTGVNNGAPSWPDRIGDGRLDDPTVERWFDTAAFVAPPPNTYGNSGRGVLYAPGTQTVDVSLSRRFPINRFRLQFRADAFNLLNTPQLGFPNVAIGSPTAGRITTTVADNRSMQFALKLDFGRLGSAGARRRVGRAPVSASAGQRRGRSRRPAACRPSPPCRRSGPCTRRRAASGWRRARAGPVSTRCRPRIRRVRAAR